MNNRRTYCIIRAVYENMDFNQNFQHELDTALESGISLIIIEPDELGLRTKQWISWGNALHRWIIHLASGSAALFCIYLFSRWRLSTQVSDVNIPGDLTTSLITYGGIGLGLSSVLCSFVYGVCWHFDPCVNYQVDTDAEQHLGYPRPTSASPTEIDSQLNGDYPAVIAASGRSMVAIMALRQPVLLRFKPDTRRFWSHNFLALITGGTACFWLYLNRKDL